MSGSTGTRSTTEHYDFCSVNLFHTTENVCTKKTQHDITHLQHIHAHSERRSAKVVNEERWKKGVFTIILQKKRGILG